MRKLFALIVSACLLCACGASEPTTQQDPLSIDAQKTVEFCTVLKYNVQDGEYFELLSDDLKSRIGFENMDEVDDSFSSEREALEFVRDNFSDFKIETSQISKQSNTLSGSILVSYFNGATSYYYLDFTYDLASDKLIAVSVYDGMDTKFN